MLQSLLYPLSEYFFVFNVFRYITFRAVMASIFAFLFSVLIGPKIIAILKDFKFYHSHERTGFEAISKKSPHKAEIPTMGGLLIVVAILLSTILWGDLSNRYLWIAVIAVAWLGLIGFVDDFLKLKKKNSKGLLATTKFSGQLLLGGAIGLFLFMDSPAWSYIDIPFLKDILIPLGPLYIAFVCLVLVGASNAVNVTDGLDGLAIGCTVFIALIYAIFSYVTGHSGFASYLYLPYIEGAGELTVFCASIAGAGMGFLWFNSHPATVFMGDTGSLSLGGAIGIVAVLIKKELLLLLVGGVFVIEVMSVILQVASFKFRGKRIFLMAPLHHHFQLKGWDESKVVIRFWIIAVIFGMAGLASLKLR